MKKTRSSLGCGVLILAGALPLAAGPARGQVAVGSGGLSVTEEWRFAVFGAGIGVTGLQIADLDGNGDGEIVAAGGYHYSGPALWFVASPRPDGTIEHVWSSEEYPGDVTSVAVAQTDGDAALEVLIGSAGRLFAYDGASHQLEFSWATPASAVRKLAVVDIDGDGALEAVFCDAFWETDALYVHTLATGALEFVGPGYGCTDLEVGNVDADPGLEIVLARDDKPGLVLDGATRAVEWSHAFGESLTLGNVDGDARVEIVGQVLPGLSIFDAELQTLERSLPVSVSLNEPLAVADVDGDGPLEILYGYGASRTIRAVDGQTGALEWEVPNPEVQVMRFAVGNLDADPALEIAWGAGWGVSDPNSLSAADIGARAVGWRSLDLEGPFQALSFGDVDADGRPEILYGSLKSEHYDSGPWFVRDAQTHVLEYQSPTADGTPSVEGLWRIANANVDGDPQQEIVVTRHRPTEMPQLVCYDGLTHAEQWHVPLPGDLHVRGLQVANVDADAALELVVTTGAPGPPHRVFVLSSATGATEWESAPLASTAALLRVGNVDADPAAEIVVAGDRVLILDAATHALDDLGAFDATALDLADLDGDGVDDIIIGDILGRVRRVSPSGAVSSLFLAPDGVAAVRATDVSGDGTPDLVLAVANVLSVRDGAGGGELWNSGPLRRASAPTWVAALDSLVVADVDADDRQEILVNVGYGVRIFEIRHPADLALSVTDAPDPALVGSDVTYTWTVANPSALAVTGVTLAVALPSGATFVSSTPGAPTCTAAAGTLTCALGTIGPAATATVAVVVTPTAAGALESAAVAGVDQPDPDATNNTAIATTTVTTTVQADLAASIDDDRVLVATGQALTYAVEVANHGPWPVTSVRLVNPLPPSLESPVYTPAIGSYDPGTGVWSGLDLQSGSSAALSLTATVAASATGTIANPLSVVPPSGVDDLVPANNSALDVDVIAADRTELMHGTSRTALLDASGERYFAIRQAPFSSYEVVVDQVSGDVGTLASPLRLERLSSGLAVLTSAQATGVAFSRSLRWMNTSAAAVDGQAVRVQSTSCTTDCGPDDAFRVRTYDTTYDLARFNNSGGQGTVVVIQNNGTAAANGRVYFWSGAGALIASVPFASLPPRGVLALNTAALPATAGQSGSVTIANDGPYGSLAGKGVAVDPATGASFDTPLRPRPR
jgi:uncharacterized repeat protein (TIGR01451 family)